jgi:hypothetical protein
MERRVIATTLDSTLRAALKRHRRSSRRGEHVRRHRACLIIPVLHTSHRSPSGVLIIRVEGVRVVRILLPRRLRLVSLLPLLWPRRAHLFFAGYDESGCCGNFSLCLGALRRALLDAIDARARFDLRSVRARLFPRHDGRRFLRLQRASLFRLLLHSFDDLTTVAVPLSKEGERGDFPAAVAAAAAMRAPTPTDAPRRRVAIDDRFCTRRRRCNAPRPSPNRLAFARLLHVL